MYWKESRNQKEYVYQYLIKGIIQKSTCTFQLESLKERFDQGLQKADWIYKVAYHIIVLIGECEERHVQKEQVNNISMESIYVLKNSEDANVFIAIEDQNKSENKLSRISQLKLLMHRIGLIFNSNQGNAPKNYLDFLMNNILNKLFPQQKGCQIQQSQILKKLYGVKIKKNIYEQSKSAVYLIEKPYFVECERAEIVVKYLETEDLYTDREIKLLEKVSKCKNCAQMFCYSNCNYKKTQFLFMRKYDITLDALNNQIGKNQLPNDEILYLIDQLLLSLQDLHNQGIIHRDLKPENIMFEYQNDNTELKNLKCVLIDFDRSTTARSQVIQNCVASEYQGTLAYQPPEGSQDFYQSHYDVWQIGYIILCILLRDKNQKYSKINNRPIDQAQYETVFKDKFEQCSQKYPTFFPIIQKMMNITPNQRPKLQEVLEYFGKLMN